MPASQPNVSGRSAPVEAAIRYIDRLIGTGELKPGDSISEPEIGAALGIGRVPVREAIRILAGEDILTLVPNKSAKVRVLDPEEVIERFELLSWLSAAALQRLVSHGHHTAVLTLIEEAGGDVAAKGKAASATAALRAMNRFNAIIVDHCGSRYLQSVARRSRMNSYTRHVVEVMGEATIKRSAAIYPLIVKAVQSGDGTRAGRILLQRSRDMVAQTLARLSPDLGELQPRPSSSMIVNPAN